MIEIKIQIRDRETLRIYKDAGDDILIEDFKATPDYFFAMQGTTTTVCRRRKTKVKTKAKYPKLSHKKIAKINKEINEFNAKYPR